MKNKPQWSGVFPEVVLPFHEDGSIDEAGFRTIIRWIASHAGISGIVVNGYTGEIMTLNPHERAEVVRIAVDELQGQLPVVSGVYVEETYEAIEHTQAIEKSGGMGVLVMPPHSWLRYSMEEDSPVQFFNEIATAINIGIIVDQYPKWTEPSYTTEQLLEITEIENVVAVNVGTRELAQYEVDVRALQKYAPDVSILTCHDDYLLPTMVQGVNGVLAGIAFFVPDWIVKLLKAVHDQNLAQAQELYNRIFEAKQAVYQVGDPSFVMIARMKEAMYQRGLLSSPATRKRVELSMEDKEGIRKGLIRTGLLSKTGKTE